MNANQLEKKPALTPALSPREREKRRPLRSGAFALKLRVPAVRELSACGPVRSVVYVQVSDNRFTGQKTCAKVEPRTAPRSAIPMSLEIQPTPRPPSRARRLLIAAGVAAALGILVWIIIPHEPVHDGRTLTDWLVEWQPSPLEESPLFEDPRSAVRSMKVEKVWPELLKMARSTDSRLRTRCREWGSRWEIPVFRSLRAAEETQYLAVLGFEALGEAGAPAVPELAALLDDPAHADTAVACLAGVGRPAEVALGRALTNANARVRYGAVFGLAKVFKNFDEMLAHIKGGLSDPAYDVRNCTVRAIGRHTEAPEAALPLLVAALADTDASVSNWAAKSLIAFGTNAAVALPALSRIAAEATDNRANSALRALVAISPDDALPVVLRQLASGSILLRHTAVILLGNYERATPEILSALEKAAADPHEILSGDAARALAKLRHEPEALRQRGWPERWKMPPRQR